MLRVDHVTVRFGDRAALEDVDLGVEEAETVCVLGPSGSGKSTLLRVVAGLQRPDTGRVLLSGRDQRGVPTHQRGLGLMFQDHQLFPQRDVGGNVAFGLRMRRTRGSEIRTRVSELLELVGLPGAERRTVASLSGGEQQRVALARALAPRPKLLMLDEPFGQLDRSLRERLVSELGELFRRLGTTVLAVTHDQGEAFALADRLVVMREGRLEQAGSPLQVWQQPASEFVARFLGLDNIVDANVRAGTADTCWGPIPVPEGSPEGARRILVRPTGVRLLSEREGLPCTVADRTFHGGATSAVSLLLRPDDGPLLRAACPLSQAPERHDRVGIAVRPDDVVVFPGDGALTTHGQDVT